MFRRQATYLLVVHAVTCKGSGANEVKIGDHCWSLLGFKMSMSAGI